MKPKTNRMILQWALIVLLMACSREEPLKWNQIQVIGSHNSYKIAIEEPLLQYLRIKDSSAAMSLQYEHPPLRTQLDLGLRNLELDVFHDPIGGRYAHPKGLGIVQGMGVLPIPFDLKKDLLRPGLKMFHIQDIDFRSHHLLFKNGLVAIKKWSTEHPDHTPIVILINAKDQTVDGTTKPLPFSKNALDSLDQEIRSVFKDEDLITPDFVRRNHPTLEEAVLQSGWPDLDEVRGRILFVLDENEEKIDRYLQGFPNLHKAAMFVNSKEGNPEAGFRIVNDPVRNFEYIGNLIQKGYMVRTRADAGTKEARNLDYTRFQKAKASGAQVISTDYYIPTTLFSSGFQVIFDDGAYERVKE